MRDDHLLEVADIFVSVVIHFMKNTVNVLVAFIISKNSETQLNLTHNSQVINIKGNSLPKRAKAKNAQEWERKGRASRKKGISRGRSTGRGETGGRKIGDKGNIKNVDIFVYASGTRNFKLITAGQ
jgi:hypothetical protein